MTFDQQRINEISGDIISAAIEVHRSLGPGLLESVYERVLAYELMERGHVVECQIPIKIRYKKFVFSDAFRADLIVDGLVLVELKSVDRIAEVHRKQVMTYLKLHGLPLGLLINFNEVLVKDGVTRIINGWPNGAVPSGSQP